MNLPDSILLRKYHSEKIRLHGLNSMRALGWETGAGQQARFDVIIELLGDLQGKSLLDAGCGHGDLRGKLGEYHEGLRYAGIDMIHEFLDVAIERYGHFPETSFYLGNFLSDSLPAMDYIVVSGALNYRNTDQDFIFKAIHALYAQCRHGLVFNLLRTTSIPMGMLVGYDPDAILDYCRTLTPNVVFKEGYYGVDYTILLRK